MREIKFRAWYFDEMYYSDFTISRNGDINWWNFDMEGYTQIPKEDVKIMQFTGLKDKNGKEIYEGDIVAYPSQPDDEDYKAIGKIVIERGNTLIADDDLEDSFDLLTNYYIEENCVDMEVIGNIYENPELLEFEE